MENYKITKSQQTILTEYVEGLKHMNKEARAALRLTLEEMEAGVHFYRHTIRKLKETGLSSAEAEELLEVTLDFLLEKEIKKDVTKSL